MMILIFGLVRFISFLVIGLFLFKWYSKKKGWDEKSQLYYIFSWISIIALLQISLDFLMGSLNILEPWISTLFFILIVIVSFFFNILIGYLLFKHFYNEDKQEAVIIILIIVVSEIIFENLVLYLIFTPFLL